MDDLIKQLKGPIAVIGGNGFIGSHLYRRIKAVRDDVVSLRALGDYLIHTYKTIFNLAGRNNDNFRSMVESNVFLVEMVLESMSKDATFIHAGSSAESEPDASLYAVTKNTASDIVMHYGMRKLKRCCTLGLYSVYGEGEREDRLLPTLRRLVSYSQIPSLGNPEAAYDFVHVDDVCRAFVIAALNLSPDDYGDYFDVASGVKVTLKDVIKMYCKWQDLNCELRWGNYETRSNYQFLWPETEETSRALGFKARITPHEGILNYFKNGA